MPQDLTTTFSLIYGTAWKEESTSQLVIEAFRAGFTAFDTAGQPVHYREDLVGQAIRQILLDKDTSRQDLYIQTKFSRVDSQHPGDTPYDPRASIAEQVRSSIIWSLYNLRSAATTTIDDTYLDCVLLHAPYDRMQDSLEAWAVLEECVPDSIRSLGVSNMPCDYLREFYRHVRVKPSVVQNAFTPSTCFDLDVRRFCVEKGIIFQAYRTLTGNTELLESKMVANLASAAGVDKEAAWYALIGSLPNVIVLDGTSRVDAMQGDLRNLTKVKEWAEIDSEAWSELRARFSEVIGDAQDAE